MTYLHEERKTMLLGSRDKWSWGHKCLQSTHVLLSCFCFPFCPRILCLIKQNSISKQQATSRSTASLLIVFVIRWTLSLSHVQKSQGRILSRSAWVTLSQWANQLSKGSITDELSLGPFPPLSQSIVNKRTSSVRTCGWVG